MIVLHTTKYGDSSIIVQCLTEEGGRESFITRDRAARPVSLLHPFSVLDCVVSHGGKGSMRHLKEFTPKIRQDSTRSDINKSSIAVFISEVLYKTLLSEGQDRALYEFIERAAAVLESLDEGCANFHIWFLVRYISLLGFDIEAVSDMEYNPFTAQQAALLSETAGKGMETFLELKLSGAQRNEFVSALMKYLSYHLGREIEIKSLAVLRSVMSV